MKSLNNFMNVEMKQTSYFQSLIISCLIEGNGKATLNTIANKAMSLKLASDEKKLISALKKYPKEVLAKHQIATLDANVYSFVSTLCIDCTVLDAEKHLAKFL